MKSKMRHIILGTCLATGLVLNCAFALGISVQYRDLETFSGRGFCKNQLNGENFSRTELFFGLSKPDGSVVTEEEFQSFIDTKVTPLFPNGLTLLTGTGQFQNSSETVVKEGSKVLILLYPSNNDTNRKIQQIRQAYISMFQQQSVLRVDEQSCVSF
ncbi:MAG: DUF3574 domain-containing protein [Scytonema sp. PMC 1069.18]|nr:DUF3574 domain-containing protein [Scytonema sp. PMC 1069.18]MEC4880207.1 DUF3574 domain-containing protein [Scytonema sp. PMC 1070.18]